MFIDIPTGEESAKTVSAFFSLILTGTQEEVRYH